MTESRKLRVFLCHASQDKPIVRELYQRLLAEGWIDPWLDEEKLLPGQDWDMEIEMAVENADAVIVCLSKNSINKEGYIQKEIRKVLDISDSKPEETIFIIPLRLENCIPPRRLQAKQYVDYFPRNEQERAIQKLFTSLRRRAESLAIEIWKLQPQLNEALLLPYSKERYIDRGEFEAISVALNQERRGILFRGERGFGKTWLAFHLHRTILPAMQGVKSFYIGLGPLPEIYQTNLLSQGEWLSKPQLQEPKVFCLELLAWLLKSLEIEYLPSSDLVMLSRKLAEGIQQQFVVDKMVLIFDSIVELDWSISEMLEEYLLGPLSFLPNTFFIMTGRGRPYPWRSPELWKMEMRTLGNFEISDFIKLPNIETLFQIMEGSPLVASFVLRKLDMEPINLIDEFIDFMIQPVTIASRKDIRLSLEAICLLDGFSEREIIEMLKNYRYTREVDWDLIRARELRENLVRAGLVRWREDNYYIENSLQNALKKFMQFKKFDEWLNLNSTAYEMYRNYSESYPRYKELFENKAKSYAKALEEYRPPQSAPQAHD